MKGIKYSFIYNVLLTGVNLLFPLLSFQYVLPLLGPASFGKTQFVLSLLQYFCIIAAIGVPVYGVREVARCKGNEQKLSILFSELLIIHAITSLLLSLIYLGVICYYGFFKADESLYLVGTVTIVTGFLSVEWVYSGLSQFRPLALRSLLIKVASLAAIYLFIKSANDYFLYFIISVATGLVANLYNAAMLHNKLKLTLHGLNCNRHIKPLLLVFSIGLGSSMYTILDTVLLGFLANDTSVGLYACAVKFCKLLLPFITTMGVVLMPELSQKMGDDNIDDARPLLQKSFEFIVFFSIPVCFGLYLLAPEIINLFSGNKFADALNCMQILAILPFLVGMGYFLSAQILIPGGRYKETLYPTLTGLVLFTFLNFLLVPNFYQNGAAIANVASETLVTLGYIYYIKKHYTISIKISSVFKTTFICLAFFPIVRGIRLIQFSTFLTFIASASTCAVIYLVLQMFLFKNPTASYLYLLRTARSGKAENNG